jgi:hypothetical protein
MPKDAGGTPGAGSQESGARSQEPGGGTPASFEAWLAGQPEDVRGLYESHTKGLRTALDTERSERSALSRQLRELQGKAEKGSDAEKGLAELQGRLELAERRATFAEEAHKPEIGCVNAKAAWALAQAEGLFDRRGNPDWAALQAVAPELFRKAVGSADGGAGPAGQRSGATGMNELLRRAMEGR